MSTQTSEMNAANVQGFIRAANQLQSNKIFFNKDFVKSANIMETCFEISKSYLGKDFNFLQDAVGVRLYIRDVFGHKALGLFEDAEGEIILDIEHALLFYYKLVALNSPSNLINAALGVFYFIAGHQLDMEMLSGDDSDPKNKITPLAKVTTKGHITPSFDLHAQFFKWKRCPFVLRKYMLQLSIPEGYKAYYFEKPTFAQSAYLTHLGHSFPEAEAITTNSQGGLFYTWLPPYIENQLIPSIMSGGFDPSLMDGYYAQSYIKDNQTIAKSYTIDDMYNVYNMFVKPNMVQLMGMIINNVKEDVAKNPYLTSTDMSIYHLSPQRLGILVKDGVKLEEVLPTLNQFFTEVPDFDLSAVLKGDFL